MNLSTMRNLLRRRVQEFTPDNWADADLDDLLRAALIQAQKAVIRVSPLAFIRITQQPLVNGEEFYSKPVSSWTEYMVLRKDAGATKYTRCSGPKPYYLMARGDYDNLSETECVYAQVGRHFAIRPLPAADNPDGFKVLDVPTLTMTVDTDVPEIHQGLHMLVVLWADRFAKGEDKEATTEVNELIKAYVEDIPSYYDVSAGENDVLLPDVDKRY